MNKSISLVFRTEGVEKLTCHFLIAYINTEVTIIQKIMPLSSCKNERKKKTIVVNHQILNFLSQRNSKFPPVPTQHNLYILFLKTNTVISTTVPCVVHYTQILSLFQINKLIPSLPESHSQISQWKKNNFLCSALS